MDKKIRVLFFCKHNSCRSQMAESILKRLGGEEFEVHSAGLNPEPIHPLVERVMKERDFSISGQFSKAINTYLGRQTLDYIIIVCQEGEAECPRLYPFAMHVDRWPLSDPAVVKGSQEQMLEAFRYARDVLEIKISEWILKLQKQSIDTD